MFGNRSRLASIAAGTAVVTEIGQHLYHSSLRQIKDSIVAAIVVTFPAEGTLLRINFRYLLEDLINPFLLACNELRDIGFLSITVANTQSMPRCDATQKRLVETNVFPVPPFPLAMATFIPINLLSDHKQLRPVTSDCRK